MGKRIKDTTCSASKHAHKWTCSRPSLPHPSCSEQELGPNSSKGRVCLSIDLVCCGNVWKETHNLLDPDKLSVGKSLSFSQVNPQTQSSNFQVECFLEYQTSYWSDWDREILSHLGWDKLKLDWQTNTTLTAGTGYISSMLLGEFKFDLRDRESECAAPISMRDEDWCVEICTDHPHGAGRIFEEKAGPPEPCT